MTDRRDPLPSKHRTGRVPTGTGIFSLDGVHPTRTGNALIANAFIDAINTRFGEHKGGIGDLRDRFGRLF